CPFAKTSNSRAELLEDARCLARFSEWVAGRSETIGILFTPWGEALIHRAYQNVLSELSQFPNVRRVTIQTNLSCRLEWLSRVNPQTLALWCTFHPGQVALERFLDQCEILN